MLFISFLVYFLYMIFIGVGGCYFSIINGCQLKVSGYMDFFIVLAVFFLIAIFLFSSYYALVLRHWRSARFFSVYVFGTLFFSVTLLVAANSVISHKFNYYIDWDLVIFFMGANYLSGAVFFLGRAR